jgi:stage II sporulation protein D (peptidoglycan lytic transglycosylase)
MKHRFPKTARSSVFETFWVLLFFSVLVCVSLFSGCEKRKLTETTAGMDSAEELWIRVLLFDNIRECIVASTSGFNVIDRSNDSASKFTSSGDVKICLKNGKIQIGEKLFSGSLTINPKDPYVVEVNGKLYRGNLKVIADKNSFDVINAVPVDAYLNGVVGAEMPSYWEPEALRTQAIAARTYALYYKKRFGAKRNWDVSTTQATQVYKGIAAESATIKDAVKKTEGKVLKTKLPNGTKGIFPTYYSSTCGGHTENSANVYGGDFYKPLSGVKCPHCKMVAKTSFYYWPMVELDLETVSKKLIKRYPSLKKLEKIVNITPSKVSDYGRLNSCKLTGSNGKTDILRGEDLRLTLDSGSKKIKSTFCKIMVINNKLRFYAGKGFGHGVGMCQYGAQRLARKGKSFKQILQYYYPGSSIEKIY